MMMECSALRRRQGRASYHHYHLSRQRHNSDIPTVVQWNEESFSCQAANKDKSSSRKTYGKQEPNERSCGNDDDEFSYHSSEDELFENDDLSLLKAAAAATAVKRTTTTTTTIKETQTTSTTTTSTSTTMSSSAVAAVTVVAQKQQLWNESTTTKCTLTTWGETTTATISLSQSQSSLLYLEFLTDQDDPHRPRGGEEDAITTPVPDHPQAPLTHDCSPQRPLRRTSFHACCVFSASSGSMDLVLSEEMGNVSSSKNVALPVPPQRRQSLGVGEDDEEEDDDDNDHDNDDECASNHNNNHDSFLDKPPFPPKRQGSERSKHHDSP